MSSEAKDGFKVVPISCLVIIVGHLKFKVSRVESRGVNFEPSSRTIGDVFDS